MREQQVTVTRATTSSDGTGSVAIRMEGISVSFESTGRTVKAVRDVTAEIARGQFVTLLGPSGCGKSTLLAVAAGLLRPTTGSVWASGQEVTGPMDELGIVQQHDSLFPWLTLARNVQFGLRIRRTQAEVRRLEAQRWIDKVGLNGFEDAYPHQLSGGMRQRANIARTMATDPDILLMDEPFGALDAMTRGELQTQIQDLWQEQQKTVLFVTHDLNECITLADRVLIMGPRPGSIIADERVELPRPRDPFSIQEHPEFASTHHRIARHVRPTID